MNRMLLTIVTVTGLLFVLLAAAGCQSSSTGEEQASTRPAPAELGDRAYDDDAEDDDDGQEEDIPLDDVPDDVMQAALDAVPGLVPAEAEREKENGVVVYCIEGTLDGTLYEVEVTAAGEVIEIEVEDEEGDDD